MAAADVDLARRALTAAWAKPPDLATVNELYHRDHLLVSDWGVEGGEHHGGDGYRNVLAELDNAWQEWHQEIDDLIDAGDGRVVALLRLVARGRGSGAPVERPWAMVITMRSGRIAESRTFLDRAAALEFARLPDSAAGSRAT